VCAPGFPPGRATSPRCARPQCGVAPAGGGGGGGGESGAAAAAAFLVRSSVARCAFCRLSVVRFLPPSFRRSKLLRAIVGRLNFAPSSIAGN